MRVDAMQLAQEGRFVILATPLGMVAAVDEATGRFGWLSVPPRDTADPAAMPEPQGHTVPLLAFDGSVFVAPRGSTCLRCHDAMTGQLRWQTPRLPVEYIVGVVGQRVLVVTPRGLLALDRATGNPIWRRPERGVAASEGRPLLVGSTLLWPTARGWLRLDAASGKLSHDTMTPVDVPRGTAYHIAGELVICTRERMVSYRDDRK
jgi:outer membrane protein assembly factor BamB